MKIILQFVVFIVVSTFIAVIVITEMESTEINKHKQLLNEIRSDKKDADDIETWLKSKGVSSSIYEFVVKQIRTKSNKISTTRDYSIGYIDVLEKRLRAIQLLALFGIITLFLGVFLYKKKGDRSNNIGRDTE